MGVPLAPMQMRLVTTGATATVYLPGGTHGFPPGSVLPLPASVAADLEAAGHLAPQAIEIPPAPPDPSAE